MGDRFLELVTDRLSGLPGLTSLGLMGGHVLYLDNVVFGIVYEGRLYLRVDDASRADFEKRGMGPFRPTPMMTLKVYLEAPPDVLEDRATLQKWAMRAAATRR